MVMMHVRRWTLALHSMHSHSCATFGPRSPWPTLTWTDSHCAGRSSCWTTWWSGQSRGTGRPRARCRPCCSSASAATCGLSQQSRHASGWHDDQSSSELPPADRSRVLWGMANVVRKGRSSGSRCSSDFRSVGVQHSFVLQSYWRVWHSSWLCTLSACVCMFRGAHVMLRVSVGGCWQHLYRAPTEANMFQQAGHNVTDRAGCIACVCSFSTTH